MEFVAAEPDLYSFKSPILAGDKKSFPKSSILNPKIYGIIQLSYLQRMEGHSLNLTSDPEP